LMILRNYRDL